MALARGLGCVARHGGGHDAFADHDEVSQQFCAGGGAGAGECGYGGGEGDGAERGWAGAGVSQFGVESGWVGEWVVLGLFVDAGGDMCGFWDVF